MHKITLPVCYDGMRYGIEFKTDNRTNKGVGHTDNGRIIGLMKDKGYLVEGEDGEKKPAAKNRGGSNKNTDENSQ